MENKSSKKKSKYGWLKIFLTIKKSDKEINVRKIQQYILENVSI